MSPDFYVLRSYGIRAEYGFNFFLTCWIGPDFEFCIPSTSLERGLDFFDIVNLSERTRIKYKFRQNPTDPIVRTNSSLHIKRVHAVFRHLSFLFVRVWYDDRTAPAVNVFLTEKLELDFLCFGLGSCVWA